MGRRDEAVMKIVGMIMARIMDFVCYGFSEGV